MGFLDRIFGKGAASKSAAVRKPIGPSLGLDELARRLGVSAESLRSARPEYVSFTIPKRSGGARKIAAPGPELKKLQRRILHKLLSRLRCHPAAHGFERGKSIVTNALPHAGRGIVLRLDLKDFFTSIKSARVQEYFHVLGWDAAAVTVLTNLCTYQGALPQGAPTSPRLSNLLSCRLDQRLSALAKKFQCSYTRYADDMTFSVDESAKPDPRAINILIKFAKMILASEGHTLHVKKKLRIQRSNQRQLVNGLVVNARVNLPRTRRRWLRAVRHRLATKGQATITTDQLKGWESLAAMVASQSKPAGSSW